MTQIDANGVYTLGPVTDTSLTGSYIVSIVSVKVGDLTFGNSPALVTPSSFKLTIINPCAATTVYSEAVADIEILAGNPETLYPDSVAAFSAFTDSVSN